MIVKICGITSREDAVAAIEFGAAALGFNFYPKSPRYVTPNAAARIIQGLPAQVWKAGVFVNQSAAGIAAVARTAGLDIAQLHGDCGPPAHVRVWRAVSAGPEFQVRDLEALEDAEAFLLDTPAGQAYGGTGKTFDWSMARGATRNIVLAGGLDAQNVREAIRQARPWGVDACSRLESAPGRKDHRKMADFLKAALSEQEP